MQKRKKINKYYRRVVTLLNSSLFTQAPGYSAEMKKESLDAFEFPNGSEWQKLINDGLFKI